MGTSDKCAIAIDGGTGVAEGQRPKRTLAITESIADIHAIGLRALPCGRGLNTDFKIAQRLREREYTGAGRGVEAQQSAAVFYPGWLRPDFNAAFGATEARRRKPSLAEDRSMAPD